MAENPEAANQPQAQQANGQDAANQPPPQQPALNPDLAGYPDTQSLVQGYRASGEEAKRQRERADAAEAMLQQLQQQQYVANPREPVPQRDSNPRQQLQDYGVPVDPLLQLVREVMKEDLVEPMMRQGAARGQVLTEYPDYNKYEVDVHQFITSDPARHQTYQRLWQGNPAEAMEWAFLKFERDRTQHARPNPQLQEDQSQTQIPGSRTGDSRSAETGQQARVQEAFRRMQSGEGSAIDFINERLNQVVPDRHLMEGFGPY